MELELLIESGFLFQIDPASITEAVKKETFKGLMHLKNVPATVLEKNNSNGRKYTKAMFEKVIKDARKDGLFERKQLLSAADDHPKATHVSPVHASHVITDAYIKEHNGDQVLFNDWLVLPTQNGRNLKGLIQAGVSIPTSIRGLGKVNETTKEVENYSYLGTDAVGNPSSGTYARPESSGGTYKVQMEMVSYEDIPEEFVSLLEKMKLIEKSVSSIKESSKMAFDLSKAVVEFKEKHYKDGKPPTVTKDLVSEIVRIEVQALQNNIPLGEDFNSFKEEVLGQIVEVTKTPVATNSNNVLAESQDILNRYERRFGAERAVASFLVGENADLMKTNEEKDAKLVEATNNITELGNKNTLNETATKKIVAAYNEVFAGFETEIDKLKAGFQVENKTLEAYNQVIESQTARLDNAREAMKELVADLQSKAKSVILSLEEDLTKSILAGETVTEHFFAMSLIANSLANSLRKVTENDRRKQVTYSRTLEARRPVTPEFKRDIVDIIRM